MSTGVFVTGMLRSGTTLAQTLLTNHPQALVAYQPFHQLYIDVKQLFLQEAGIDRHLPLDDGAPSGAAERAAFSDWLGQRRFSVEESDRLASACTAGKGGGLGCISALHARPGCFFTLRDSLHQCMAERIGKDGVVLLGSKEILCEEYVPALVGAGIPCVLIVRDPRGVIASANSGRYLEQVGDRYPLLMLIRLWRKTAAYALQYRNNPRVRVVRFEDLIVYPASVMNDLAQWLGIDAFPESLYRMPLQDHFGNAWSGNSSFGEKAVVDASAGELWQARLPVSEQRFIAACTRSELAALGYPLPDGLGLPDILSFEEDVTGVRASYLQWHEINDAQRHLESERMRISDQGSLAELGTHFLFPESILAARNGNAMHEC